MFFVLLLLWIVFNGKLTAEIVVLGVLLSAAVFAFSCKFLGYSVKRDLRIARNAGLMLRYIAVLLYEIFKANIYVVRFIIVPKAKPEPVLVHFTVPLKSDAAKVVLAHSITLTPGTITVELRDNEYVVHCLDKSMAEGMGDSRFVRMLERMEAKNG